MLIVAFLVVLALPAVSALPCPKGTWGVQPNCAPCPNGGYCPTNTTSAAKMQALGGYWRPSPNVTTFAKCRIYEACNATNATCADGYRGALCNACAPGYGIIGSYLGDHLCKPCQPRSATIRRFIVMLAGGVAFSACAILVALWFGSEKRDDELMMFKILISHFQLISIVASFPFSDNFRWVTDTLDFINFATTDMSDPLAKGLDCIVPEHATQSIFWLIILPAGTIVGVCAFWITAAKLLPTKSPSPDEMSRKFDASVATLNREARVIEADLKEWRREFPSLDDLVVAMNRPNNPKNIPVVPLINADSNAQETQKRYSATISALVSSVKSLDDLRRAHDAKVATPSHLSRAACESQTLSLATNYRSRALVSIVTIAFLAYPFLVDATFALFSCSQPIMGKRYLNTDFTLECFGPEHAKIALTLGLFSILAWSIGIPASFLAIMVRLKNATGGKGVFYPGRKEAKLREGMNSPATTPLRLLMTLARQPQACLAFCTLGTKGTTFGGRYPSSKATYDDRHGAPRGLRGGCAGASGLLVLTLALILEVKYAPYDSNRVDRIAVSALSTSTLSLYLGLFMFISPSSGDFVSFSIITINAAFLVKFLWTLVNLVKRRIEALREREATILRMLRASGKKSGLRAKVVALRMALFSGKKMPEGDVQLRKAESAPAVLLKRLKTSASIKMAQQAGADEDLIKCQSSRDLIAHENDRVGLTWL